MRLPVTRRRALKTGRFFPVTARQKSGLFFLALIS